MNYYYYIVLVRYIWRIQIPTTFTTSLNTFFKCKFFVCMCVCIYNRKSNGFQYNTTANNVIQQFKIKYIKSNKILCRSYTCSDFIDVLWFDKDFKI